jgi:hypothetical protein
MTDALTGIKTLVETLDLLHVSDSPYVWVAAITIAAMYFLFKEEAK